jgi:hypothetical protein
VTQSVEQPEQEDMVEDLRSRRGGVASDIEPGVRCGAAACLGRVLSGRRARHTDDLPGLTVRVSSAMLYAPERLSLPKRGTFKVMADGHRRPISSPDVNRRTRYHWLTASAP